MYRVSLNPYEIGINTKDKKKIIIDDKEVILSVGSCINYEEDFKATLNIEVYYAKNEHDSLTSRVPQLKCFDNKIAINPKFKNQKVIEKLRDLGILSETIEKVKNNMKLFLLILKN